MALWHPDAVRRIHIDAGGFTGGGRKLVWHTTEGGSLPNYGGDAPHFTLDPEDGRLWQHIPLNRAARALKAGGPNFWNTAQVELIGFADEKEAKKHGLLRRAVINWTDAEYARVAKLARWIEANFDVPRTCNVEFVHHTAHLASLDAVKRYAGHIGHQHINGNDHWDPGLLKIAKVLDKAHAGSVPVGPVHGGSTVPGVAIRDLGRGDKGEDVKALQRILVKRGYKLLKGNIKGVFGPATEAFVVHFQWRHGLKIDGVVGEDTRAALGLVPTPTDGVVREIPGLELGLGPPLAEHVHMGTAQPPTAAVTTGTRLIAAPRATRGQIEGYLLGRPHGSYDERQVRTIARLYDETSQSVGLDPLLVVAQMVLETGNLCSFWSQPPRRNPAGIGVTGVPGEGISFANWRAAVTAHVGRLLAYALAKGAGNGAQRQLIKKALDVRPLPDDRFGVAPTLKGLAGSWAMDPKYANKLVGVAKEISASNG
jgi:Putative peptidoglycan binding domain/Mannosyl-glycoprotein endo-beta-N-acetylglucosaminidase/N-acetylmuramoyl-L-alanine amidase